MAKYFINEDRLTGNELWLAYIANEQAEANRLKRIELELRAGSFHYSEERHKEITEDKA